MHLVAWWVRKVRRRAGTTKAVRCIGSPPAANFAPACVSAITAMERRADDIISSSTTGLRKLILAWLTVPGVGTAGATASVMFMCHGYVQ